MLCQFTFWNYKSYKDEVTLDFCPAKVTEHKEHLLKEPITCEEFLPIAVIYGPNGGGKTVVINSFRFLRAKILDIDHSAKGSEENNEYEQISFLFDRTYSKSPTGWCVSFITAGYEYKYLLAILGNQVSAESLHAKNLETGEFDMLFEREYGKIELGETFSDIQAGNVKAELPLLSFISKLYSHEHILNIIRWFKGITVIDNAGSVAERFIYFPDDKDDDSFKSEFYRLLHSMGIQIDGMRVSKDSEGKVQNIFTVYNYSDNEIHIEFKHESSGTQKIFSFLRYVVRAIQEGRPIFIDELDAKLHPKLLEVIISLFTNPKVNQNGAQLIITSHDLHILNNKYLRRDEIWFAAKSDDFSSHLYSLSDFKKISSNGNKTRKDENYAKQYLEGRYGADPYFQRIESWVVET